MAGRVYHRLHQSLGQTALTTDKRRPIAKRGESAIRVIRAVKETGIGTVGILSEEGRLALHRFKPDQPYHAGIDAGPVEAYLEDTSAYYSAIPGIARDINTVFNGKLILETVRTIDYTVIIS